MAERISPYSRSYLSSPETESEHDVSTRRIGSVAKRHMRTGSKGKTLRGITEPNGRGLPSASKTNVAVHFRGKVEGGTAVRLQGAVGGVGARFRGAVGGAGFASNPYEVAIVDPTDLPAGAPPNEPTYLFYTSGNVSRKIPVSDAQNQQDMSTTFSAIKHLLSETNPAAIQVRQRIFERQVDQGGGVIVTEKYDLVNRDSIRALLASNTNRNVGDIGDAELDEVMGELDQLCTQSSEILQRIDPFEETGNVWKPNGVGDLRAQHTHEVLKRFDSKPGFQHKFIRKGMYKLGLVDVNGNLTLNGKRALKEMAGSRAYIKEENTRLERELLLLRQSARTPRNEAEIQKLEQQLAELNNLSRVAMDWMIMQANRPKAGTTLRDWLNRADTTPRQRIVEAERSASDLLDVLAQSRSIKRKVKAKFGWADQITKEESLAHGIYFFGQPVMAGEGRPTYLRFCEQNHLQAMHDPEKERDIMHVVSDIASGTPPDGDAPDGEEQAAVQDAINNMPVMIPSFEGYFSQMTEAGLL